MNRVLNLILTHQGADAIAAMVARWEKCVPRESLLIAHGGSRADFEAISGVEKVQVEDARLRTRDHPRERQSYGAVMRAAVAKMAAGHGEFVHFAEYDHVPLVAELNDRQVALLQVQQADVLGYHLRRVDDTNSPHFLYAAAEPAFFPLWKSFTRRADPRVVLSMIATGSFWTREAFTAVAELAEPHPIYVEIFLPTAAHHLGFRVRDFGVQTQFVRHAGEWQGAELEAARAAGAWTVHPVKREVESRRGVG